MQLNFHTRFGLLIEIEIILQLREVDPDLNQSEMQGGQYFQTCIFTIFLKTFSNIDYLGMFHINPQLTDETKKLDFALVLFLSSMSLVFYC